MGYKNKLVEVRNGVVYLFDGKLWSAPLERVVEYYREGQGLSRGQFGKSPATFIAFFLEKTSLGKC